MTGTSVSIRNSSQVDSGSTAGRARKTTFRTFRGVARLMAIGGLIGLVAATGLGLVSVPTARAKETITVMMSYTNPQRKAAFDSLAAAFEKATGIHAELAVDTSGQTYLKMKLMAAAGKPPEVFAGGAYAYDLAAAGLLVDMNPLLARDGLSGSPFFPGALAVSRYRGMQYALPYGVNTAILAYNVDAVEQSGLQAPGAWGDPAWTWEAYGKLAAKLTRDANGDGNPEMYGGKWGPNETFDIPWMFGSGWVTSDGLWNITSNGVVRSFQFCRKLMYELKAAPAPGSDKFWSSVADGGLAMSVTGTWNILAYAKAIKGFRWNLAGVPVGTDLPKGAGYASPVYPDGFAIFKGGNTEAAWKWVKFILFNPANLWYWCDKVVEQMPATLVGAKRYVEQMSQVAPALDLRQLLQAPNYSQVQTLFFNVRSHEIEQIANEGAMNLLQPDVNVENGLKTLQARLALLSK